MTRFISAGDFGQNYAETYRKIRSFGTLPVGWHYGKGAPVLQEIVDIALTYLGQFMTLGFSETDAFVGASGEIMVKAYRGAHRIELTVECDKTFNVAYEVDGDDKFYEAGLSGLEASEAIGSATASIDQYQCGILSSLILKGITIDVQANSRTWLSKLLVTGAERQLSENSVGSARAALSAVTSINSTQVLEANRPYFGDLMKRKSLPLFI